MALNKSLITKSDNTITSQITETLRDAIIAGEIEAGSKLSEPKLALHYQVSRGPIREAIRRLEMMSLVQHVPHEGVRVVTLEPQEIIQIYHVREVLEGKAAALAAEHMTSQEISQLGDLLDAHKRMQVTTGEYLSTEADYDFHYQIIRGSKNTVLVRQLVEGLYQLIRMFRYQTGRIQSRSAVALREHQQLFYAIEARDSMLAEIVMRRHIVHARKEIENRQQ